MKSLIQSFLFSALLGILLLGAVRGLPGNPTPDQLNTPAWKEEGPFELSPERGRFALLMSLAENGSFTFSRSIASFALPDLGYTNGNFVSLFAPGVSFLLIPGYWVGKLLGASQVGASLVVALFALGNALLVKAIAGRLGARPAAAALAGMAFLFASPAFAYSASLYQHHVSTFLILASLYALLAGKGFLSLAVVFLLCAASVSVDYPNVFIMFPIGLFALSRVFSLTRTAKKTVIGLHPVRLLALVFAVFPILFFAWFNYRSYGNPFQLSGTVQNIRSLEALDNPHGIARVETESGDDQVLTTGDKRSALTFFETRNLINGFYIHLFSPDRGIVYFTPVLLLGVIGMWMAYRTRHPLYPVLVAVILTTFVLYSMWGDPWGGWAFGSRYLIPAYALLAVFTGIALSRFSRRPLFITVFLVLFSYSAAVNTLGAITTNTNPPRIEILALERVSGKRQLYTWERNWEYLNSGSSKSFVYRAMVSPYLTPVQYFAVLSGVIIFSAAFLGVALFLSKHDQSHTH